MYSLFSIVKLLENTPQALDTKGYSLFSHDSEIIFSVVSHSYGY